MLVRDSIIPFSLSISGSWVYRVVAVAIASGQIMLQAVAGEGIIVVIIVIERLVQEVVEDVVDVVDVVEVVGVAVRSKDELYNVVQ